jgi:hypothetical protein
MRIATWNINNRVGQTTFRPEAALAVSDLGADLIALTGVLPSAAGSGLSRVFG